MSSIHKTIRGITSVLFFIFAISVWFGFEPTTLTVSFALATVGLLFAGVDLE